MIRHTIANHPVDRARLETMTAKPDSYWCPVCQKPFDKLKEHIVLKLADPDHAALMPDEEKQRYYCSECDKFYKDLGQHQDIVHIKPFVCTEPDCEFACGTIQKLKRHLIGRHKLPVPDADAIINRTRVEWAELNGRTVTSMNGLRQSIGAAPTVPARPADSYQPAPPAPTGRMVAPSCVFCDETAGDRVVCRMVCGAAAHVDCIEYLGERGVASSARTRWTCPRCLVGRANDGVDRLMPYEGLPLRNSLRACSSAREHMGVGLVAELYGNRQPTVPAETTIGLSIEPAVPDGELAGRARFVFRPPDAGWAVDLTHAPTPLKWVNHSFGPNCELTIWLVEPGLAAVQLSALRPLRTVSVRPGVWLTEELTVRYRYRPADPLPPWYSPVTMTACTVHRAAAQLGRGAEAHRLPWPITMDGHKAAAKEYARAAGGL